jgi:hypothetical protein
VWPRAEDVYVDALDARARSLLAQSALRRAGRALWGESAPAAVTAESDWILARPDGPLTGRLVETLFCPDTIRRDYYPAGPDLVISTWLVADSLGASIQGAPRDTLPGEAQRVVDRLDADAWNVVRAATSGLGRVAYTGAVRGHGAAFQSLELATEQHVLRLWLDPETGLPSRVFIDRGPGHVTSEYRFSSYLTEEGTRYPGRIERHVGARREATFTVRAYAKAARLAAPESLK